MTAPQDPDEFADPVYRDPTAGGDYYGDSDRAGSGGAGVPSTPVPPPAPPPQPAPVPPFQPEPFQPAPFQPDEPRQSQPVQPEPMQPEWDRSGPASAGPKPADRSAAFPSPVAPSPESPSPESPAPATWLPEPDQQRSGSGSARTWSAGPVSATWSTTSSSAPPGSPPMAPPHPVRYPPSSGGYGPGRPYPRQFGTGRRRRGGKTGCIIPVVVVAVIVIFNVATGFGKLFNRDSSDGGSSRYTPSPTPAIATSVQNYFLAAGVGNADRAENYVCGKDRSAWRANAQRAGVDPALPVRETSTTEPSRSGDGYDTTATVTFMSGRTATRSLHLVQEDDLYRICGGLI